MTTPQTPRLKILCVDDEPGIVRSIRRILKSEQVDVLTAAGGPEGLAVLQQHGDVALVLTDYRMPEMNGIEFLEQVAQLCPHAFRIILTGYAEAHVLVDAVNRGQIYKILYKPFQEDDIRLTVRSGLQHFSQASENQLLLKQLEIRNAQLAVLNEQLKAGLDGTRNDLAISSSALGLAQQLLNDIPAAVVGVEPSGEIVFANRAANAWWTPAHAEPSASIVGAWIADVMPVPVQRAIEAVARGAHDEQETEVECNAHLRLSVTCRPVTTLGETLSPRPVVVFAMNASKRVMTCSSQDG